MNSQRGLVMERMQPAASVPSIQAIDIPELGQKLNLSVLSVLREHWLPVGFMLIFSIVMALVSGYVLFRVLS
jgi:uncharacterized membrane protein AbrB (regulator of aidB expression)